MTLRSRRTLRIAPPIIALLALLALVAGCAAPTPYTKPDYLGGTFDAHAVTEVALAPVLDLRVDKSEALELDAWVHASARQFMTRRGYPVRLYADRSLIAALETLPTREEIAARVKDFELPGAPRHILVFGLIDAYSKLTFGSTGNAEMVAYLVDTQRREVVLSHKVVSQAGQGGVVGMFMRGLIGRTAIETAAMKLVHSIPPRTGNR
jgi:hypothetical protein